MLKTYELIKMLTPKLGEEEAKELVSFVEESRGDTATKADLQIFATKTDLQIDLQILKTDLEKQIQAVKSDLERQIQGVKSEVEGVKSEVQGVKLELQDVKSDVQGVKSEVQGLKSEVQGVKSDLEKQIQTVKVDLLKWLFGFWITLLIAIILILIKTTSFSH